MTLTTGRAPGEPLPPAAVEGAPGFAWYALRTRSRHEKVVRDELLARGYRAVPSALEPLEPLEGPPREDRHAALPWLLLRAL